MPEKDVDGKQSSLLQFFLTQFLVLLEALQTWSDSRSKSFVKIFPRNTVVFSMRFTKSNVQPPTQIIFAGSCNIKLPLILF